MCEVSNELGQGCWRYGQDKKTKLKITRGNNSKKNKKRVMKGKNETPAHHSEEVWEVSGALGHGCRRYGPDKGRTDGRKD